MSNNTTNDSLLDVFLFETSQLIGQLEQAILAGEKEYSFDPAAINEIFRIMHTIKGSAAMMLTNVSVLAHSMEDIFYYLREDNPEEIDYSKLSDLVLEGIDFIKIEAEKLQNGDNTDGNAEELISRLKEFLTALKQKKPSGSKEKNAMSLFEPQDYSINENKENNENKECSDNKENNVIGNYAYKAVVFYDDGCQMENIRAYTLLHNLQNIATELSYVPENILDSDSSIEVIRQQGFKVYFKSDYSYDKMHAHFMNTIFLKNLELVLREKKELPLPFKENDKNVKEDVMQEQRDKNFVKAEKDRREKEGPSAIVQQSIISVSVLKLDKLMNLVGELVIAEAMVIQNPDLQGLELDNFEKAARQLVKISSEIQEMVMAIRMVPLSTTFQRMNRIVRDMCKKLDKEILLHIIGEETEVDKNIIEHISDPLMHLVRNAIDHGVETSEERKASGKSPTGSITLEAKSDGGDVFIMVKDDGKGLDKEKILQKARKNGIISKSDGDMTDREIYNLILLPGFSTNENITEYSGRGVGMDVVMKNLEKIGGELTVASNLGKGTSFMLKIPLTLAIVDGMNIKVGAANYTLPTNTIRESFRPDIRDIIKDPEGNEMIMVRGECYPIIRLHEFYKIETDIVQFDQGIIIMVEQDGKSVGIFADELLGQQQVVVKALPKYIEKFRKIKGLGGCTLLGDGNISLILDPNRIVNM